MKLTHLLGSAVCAACLALSLPACQSTSIPMNAPLMASGTGNTSFTATNPGTVYVRDKTWNKTVYIGHVAAGQMVKVDANADKVLVDNQTRVEQIPLGEGSEYQFFFRNDPGYTVQRTTTTTVDRPIHRETVIERDIAP